MQPECGLHTECTEDTMFSGRLTCVQHRLGYRYSIDSLLLAHFVAPKKDDHILDLGAGCGIVSLILAYRWPDVTVSAFEIQNRFVSLIRRNIEKNRFQDRIRVIEGDLCGISKLIEPGAFELVVSNPPYRKSGSGRLNPEKEQAIARHEIVADLRSVIRAALFAVKNRGRAAFVYPAARGAALMAELKSSGLEPKRLRIIHSYPGGDGKLVLIECVKNGREELKILPPFFVYTEPGGEYTEEMARIYESDY
ncbi:MAG: tRNA1(Val) (adenine(37)-N6)-methyltransferase [Desulfobulbaceae bacterium]|nr:tRNA1(Val) (adenine(37)-N6)-methyltransferase [Desulfobulbaceae bacterium]